MALDVACGAAHQRNCAIAPVCRQGCRDRGADPAPAPGDHRVAARFADL
jgi:hypothetical protein